MRAADLVAIGPVFDGETVGLGYVAIIDSKVAAVSLDGLPVPEDLVGENTRVVEVPTGLITPGLLDDHTFFTSQLLEVGGVQAGELDAAQLEDAVARSTDPVTVVLGVDDAVSESVFSDLTARFPDKPIVLLSTERAHCLQSPQALRLIGPADGASNEGLAPIYATLASNPEYVDAALDRFAGVASAAGVVAVKDIAFDRYLGMLGQIRSRSAEDGFPLVMACASQPVLAPADLDYWATETDVTGSDGPHFRGFKLMTDGSFDEGGGALIEGSGRNNDCDWDPESTSAEARRIISAGQDLILNADGDLAVRECIAIFERLREEFGTLPSHCTLSDASIMSPADAERVAALGIPVETYPQMTRFDYYSDAFLDEYLTPEGRRHFAPFDHTVRSGGKLLAATDFPLVEPSLPESILSATFRLLPGDTAAEPLDARGIDRIEVLKAWTSNSGDFMGLPGYSGRIREGDPANLAVFDTDLSTAPAAELADAEVILTVARGVVTHDPQATVG